MSTDLIGSRHFLNPAHGALFSTGELVYVQGHCTQPWEAAGGLPQIHAGPGGYGCVPKYIPPAWGPPYAKDLLLRPSPLKREPHGPDICLYKSHSSYAPKRTHLPEEPNMIVNDLKG